MSEAGCAASVWEWLEAGCRGRGGPLCPPLSAPPSVPSAQLSPLACTAPLTPPVCLPVLPPPALPQAGQLGTGNVRKLKGAEDQSLTPQLVSAVLSDAVLWEVGGMQAGGGRGLVAHAAGGQSRVAVL